MFKRVLILIMTILSLTLLAGCGGGGGSNTPPALGSLTLSSTPSGANIIIDGKPTNNITPFTLTSLSPGIHQVTLSKIGYPDYSQEVLIEAGETTFVSANLAKDYVQITGYVTDSRAGGGVEGTRVETPYSYNITDVSGFYTLYAPVGIYDIVATKPGRALAVIQDVSISANTQNQVNLIQRELFDQTTSAQTLKINVTGLQPEQVVSSTVNVTVKVDSSYPLSQMYIRIGHLDPLYPDYLVTDDNSISFDLDPTDWGNQSSFLNICAYDIQYNYTEYSIPFSFSTTPQTIPFDTTSAPSVSVTAYTFSKSLELFSTSELSALENLIKDNNNINILSLPPNTSSFVDISWSYIDGADGYKIYRSIAGQDYTPIADMPPYLFNFMYDSDPSLTPGIPISYIVQAYDSTGNFGPKSSPVEVYLLKPLDVKLVSPANNATDVSRKPTFTWDHSQIDVPGKEIKYYFSLFVQGETDNDVTISQTKLSGTSWLCNTELFPYKRYLWDLNIAYAVVQCSESSGAVSFSGNTNGGSSLNGAFYFTPTEGSI